MTSHNKTGLMGSALTLTACFLMLAPAYAAAPQPRPPSGKPPPMPTKPYTKDIRTRSEVQVMKRRAMAAQRAKIKQAQDKMNGMADAAIGIKNRTGIDLAIQPQERRALNRAINELGQAKAELARQQKESLGAFAAARNIRMIPDPPTTPPPAAPPRPQGPPGAGGAARNIKESKAWRPPGNSAPRVAVRQTDY